MKRRRALDETPTKFKKSHKDREEMLNERRKLFEKTEKIEDYDSDFAGPCADMITLYGTQYSRTEIAKVRGKSRIRNSILVGKTYDSHPALLEIDSIKPIVDDRKLSSSDEDMDYDGDRDSQESDIEKEEKGERKEQNSSQPRLVLRKNEESSRTRKFGLFDEYPSEDEEIYSDRSWFKVKEYRDWRGMAYLETVLVHELQSQEPRLSIQLVRRDGKFYIQTLDGFSTRYLLIINKVKGKEILFEKIKPIERVQKCVIRIPKYLDVEVLAECNDRVISMVRLRQTIFKSGTRIRQAAAATLVSYRGRIPIKIDFKGFGSFDTAKYIQQPIRCNNCIKYGHTAKVCNYQKACGVCGQAHNSSVCFEQLNNGREIPYYCINCEGRHMGVARKCPLRVALLIEEGGSNDKEDTYDSPFKEEIFRDPKGFLRNKRSIIAKRVQLNKNNFPEMKSSMNVESNSKLECMEHRKVLNAKQDSPASVGLVDGTQTQAKVPRDAEPSTCTSQDRQLTMFLNEQAKERQEIKQSIRNLEKTLQNQSAIILQMITMFNTVISVVSPLVKHAEDQKTIGGIQSQTKALQDGSLRQ